MGIEHGEVNLVKKMLWPGEAVQLTARERRVGPGGSFVNPTSVIATDKRLIIVNKTAMGLRKDIESIPYKQITSVRMEHGIISSSVFIRVQGYDTDTGFLKKGNKQEGEIEGLNNKDAKDLSDYIGRIISEGTVYPGAGQGAPDVGSSGGFCPKCGAKLAAGAKFCSKCGAKV